MSKEIVVVGATGGEALSYGEAAAIIEENAEAWQEKS